MAVVEIVPNPSGKIVAYVGLLSELATAETEGIGAGSTYWAKDEKVGYLWDGDSWEPIN